MSATSADKKKSRATSSFPMPQDTWDVKLREHHDRITKVKSSIPKDVPYQLTFRSPRQSPRGPRALPPAGTVLTASSMRGSTSPRTPRSTCTPNNSLSCAAGRSSSSSGHPSDATTRRVPLALEDLTESERSACEAVMRFLQGRTSEESKDILEAMYVQSETRRLLKGYGGIYPNMMLGSAGSINSRQEGETEGE